MTEKGTVREPTRIATGAIVPATAVKEIAREATATAETSRVNSRAQEIEDAVGRGQGTAVTDNVTPTPHLIMVEVS